MADRSVALQQLRVDLVEYVKFLILELTFNDSLRYEDYERKPSFSWLKQEIKSSSFDVAIERAVDTQLGRKEFMEMVMTANVDGVDFDDEDLTDEEREAQECAYYDGIEALQDVLAEMGFTTLSNLHGSLRYDILDKFRDAILRFQDRVRESS